MATQNKEKLPPKGKIKFTIELSEEQKEAKAAVLERPVNFLMGRAGSGKTLLAVQIALDMFFTRKVNKIIITRPTVGTEHNGFVPGSLKEKLEQWMVPIRSNMRKVYNKPEILASMETDGNIELVSLEHFRGQTFDDAVCIIDEFQNLTKEQLAMAIGRLGKNSIMIFTGDAKQIDLRYVSDSASNIVDKIKDSPYVNKIVLSDNHRHECINDIFDRLYSDQ